MLTSIKLVLAVLVLCISAVSDARTGEATDRTYVSAAELDHLIRLGTAPTIIDVRSSYEYQAGHIPGAIHIPFWSAFFRVDEISAC